jgi:hypothetical protein
MKTSSNFIPEHVIRCFLYHSIHYFSITAVNRFDSHSTSRLRYLLTLFSYYRV